MATYVNDLRLKEIGTGESSGTWGTETNVNLELIGEALGYATEGITTNADTHTTTVADGSTDPGRAMYIKYTGTLDSACTITIAPNTMSRVHLIENATSGSQNIIISQGSGANVTIPAGDVKVVYLDGAGSGAAVVDAFASLNVVDLKVEDDLTLTSDSAVITFGADGDTTLTHTDGSGLTLNSTNKIMFNDASQFIQGSSATVLALGATDEIDLTATAIDVNGTMDVSGLITAAAKVRITDTGNTTVAALQFTDAGLGISAPTTDQLNFITADTTRFSISSAGTVTFEHPIVLQSGATQGLYIENNAGNATTPRITNDANDHTVIRPGKSGGAVQYNNFANDAERMRLTDAGNLGIADSSPAEKLAVTGAIVAEGDHATGVNAMGATAGILLHASSPDVFVTATSNGSNNRNMQLRALSAGSANPNQLFLEYTGNVGIGTATCLNVFDTQFSAAAHTSGISITNQQNGGYGSTLAFNSSRSDDSSIKTAARIRTEGAESWNADSTTSSNLILETRSDNTLAERARLAADGDFAIGATSVDAKLTVYGESGGGFNSRFTSGTNYQDFTLFFDTANGNGTANFRPVTLPGSGAANMAFRFRTNTSGSASTNANVVIDGSLGKGSGSFLIDHPLESMTETHQLYHSFIEGPQADLIYRGKVELVNGKAAINIDEVSNMTEGTFCSLNRDTQCFTTNETDWDSVKGSVEGNILTIESQNASSSATISWMVVGERCDKHMFDTDWTDDNGKVITEKVKPENYHGGPEVKQADIAH
jgi:hypothetical protein